MAIAFQFVQACPDRQLAASKARFKQFGSKAWPRPKTRKWRGETEYAYEEYINGTEWIIQARNSVKNMAKKVRVENKTTKNRVLHRYQELDKKDLILKMAR